MPFVSKKQQRWMWANKPEMAKEWSKETNFKQLPEKKKKKKKQEGGVASTNDPSMDAISKVLLWKNRDKNFVDRVTHPQGYPKIQTNTIKSYEKMPDSEYSTMLMAYSQNRNGTGMVYPEIVQKSKNAPLEYLGSAAWDYAHDNNEKITTPSWKVADYMSNRGYKNASNQMFGTKYQQGGYSTEGYKANSPDKNNHFNIIPSSDITMQGVKHPVVGIDNTGFQQLMMPGQDYKFQGDEVFEIPIKKEGGMNPAHKRWCTPITKSTCTGKRKQFAINMKKRQDGGTINMHPIDRNYGAAPTLNNLQPLQIPNTAPIKEKEDINLSFAPLFMNSMAMALANKVDRSRERNYEMTNLANPLKYIPQTNNTDQYVNYGTPTYQEGGSVGVADASSQEEYEDLQDEDFLYGNDSAPAESAEETPEPTLVPEEVPQDEPERVIELDTSSSPLSEDEGGDLASNYGEEFAMPRFAASGSATQREAEATDYLVQKGLPTHVAAGIVGNLTQESSLDPNAVQKDGNGRGIAQWDARDRFQQLKQFASSQGKPYNSLTTQLDYLLHEADQRGDLQKIKAATNPSEAAYLFAKHFERPKRIEDVRMRNAERIFKNRRT